MAFGAIRQTEYDDPLGKRFRLTIYRDNYSGTVTDMDLASPGAVLSYDFDSSGDIYNPIASSSLSFSLIVQSAADESFVDSMATNTEGKFAVSLEEKTGSNYHKRWLGIILNDLTSIDFEDRPFAAAIQATDDLPFALRYDWHELDYSTSVLFADVSFADILCLALRRVRWFELSDTGIPDLQANVSLSAPDIDGTAQNVLQKLFLNTHGLLDEGRESGVSVQKSVAVSTVLKSLLLTLNARLFQYNGGWVVQDLTELCTSPTSISPGHYSYGASGAVVASTDVLANLNNPINFTKAIDVAKVLSGSTRGYLQPVRKVTRTQKVDGDVALVYSSAYGTSYGGTNSAHSLGDTITDGGFLFKSGTVLRLLGSLHFERNQDTSISSFAPASARIARPQIQFSIKVGNKYAVRQFENGTSGAFFQPNDESSESDPDPGVPYGFDNPSNVGTWSPSSAAEFQITGLPFDRASLDIDASSSFDIVLPPLLEDSEGIEISAQIHQLNGPTFQDAGALTGSDGEFVLFSLALGFAEGFGPSGDTIEFSAVASNNASETLQSSVEFGDSINLVATRSLQYENTSGDIVLNENTWTTAGTTGGGLNLNTLCALDIAKHRNKVRRRIGFQIYRNDLDPRYALTLDGDTYILCGFSYETASGLVEIEAVEGARTSTAITTTSADSSTKSGVRMSNPRPINVQRLPGDKAVGFAANVSGSGISAADAAKLASITANASGEITDFTVATGSTPLLVSEVSGAATIASVQNVASDLASLSSSVSDISTVVKDNATGGLIGFYHSKSAGTTQAYLGLTSNTADIEAGGAKIALANSVSTFTGATSGLRFQDLSGTPLDSVAFCTGQYEWGPSSTNARIHTGGQFGIIGSSSWTTQPSQTTITTYSSSHAVGDTATLSAKTSILYAFPIPNQGKKFRFKIIFSMRGAPNSSKWGFSTWKGSAPNSGTNTVLLVTLCGTSSDITCTNSSSNIYTTEFDTNDLNNSHVFLMAEHRSVTISSRVTMAASIQILETT